MLHKLRENDKVVVVQIENGEVKRFSGRDLAAGSRHHFSGSLETWVWDEVFLRPEVPNAWDIVYDSNGVEAGDWGTVSSDIGPFLPKTPKKGWEITFDFEPISRYDIATEKEYYILCSARCAQKVTHFNPMLALYAAIEPSTAIHSSIQYVDGVLIANDEEVCYAVHEDFDKAALAMARLLWKDVSPGTATS